MNIEDHIPFGKENAISRQSLCMITGLSDRKVRDAIHKARRTTPILNMQNGTGYYRPTKEDRAEAEHWLKQETCRAKSIFWSIASMRKWLKE